MQLTAAQKAAKKKRIHDCLNGKQKRVKRPPIIDSMYVDEFSRVNTDPIWLHQNEMSQA